MRAGPQQPPVLDRRRLALLAVDEDDVLPRLGGDRRELAGEREGRAAAAAQAAGRHGVDEGGPVQPASEILVPPVRS
jgi:hypothetical protein